MIAKAPHRVVSVLSAGAPKTAIADCARAFEAEAGVELAVEFATAPAIRDRLDGDDGGVDVVVAPLATLSAFRARGLLAADGEAPVGGIKAAVAVRAGAIPPDISSADAVKRAVLAAGSLVYNQASSGQYIETMMERLGIAEAVAAKTIRLATGAAVMEHLATSRLEGEIGFGQATEIRVHASKGVVMVGPLPAALGNVTTYAAALLAAAAQPEPARRFLAYLESQPARELMAAAGVG